MRNVSLESQVLTLVGTGCLLYFAGYLLWRSLVRSDQEIQTNFDELKAREEQ